MAAATTAQIRQGIANSLAALGTASGAAIFPYRIDSPTPPCLYVMGTDGVTYDLTMQRGLDEWVFVVMGFVGPLADKGSQVKLDEWLDSTGPKSVKAAIEADITLGGIIQGLHVETAGGYRVATFDNRTVALGADWTVRVWNTGK